MTKHSFIDIERRKWLTIFSSFPLAGMFQPQFVEAKPERLEKQRIICVGSAITEIVFALNADPMIVAVDTSSMYPEAARSLPSVGYSRTLSAEGILALSPTQILLSGDAGPPGVIRQLRDSRISIHQFLTHCEFSGVCEQVIGIGEVVHRQRQADHLKQKLLQEWTLVGREMISKRQSIALPRTLYIHSMNPMQIMVSGQDTKADAMIRYAGLQNAMRGFKGYKPFTPEAVISSNPDLILVTDQGIKALGGLPNLARLPGLANINAIKQQRVISMDAVFLLGFGPRMPEAVLMLHRRAHQLLA